MSEPVGSSYMSVEEYLKYEQRATVKHEYVDGQIFAMNGATHRHTIIAGNLHVLLHGHVKGSPCRAYIFDLKVRVQATNSFYYPDVMVACGKFDQESVFETDPVLIVEVLSPSTAHIDRREKLLAYRRIESLREYLIVHQKGKRVQLHRREGPGTWTVMEYGPGAELVLEAIPGGVLKFPIDAIYEGVSCPQKDETSEVRETDEDDIEAIYDDAEGEGALSW